MLKGVLLGIAIGDAIGVPYEFKSRKEMSRNPAIGMVGHGTHDQPVGTWSDDTSLSLCLAESISEGFNLDKLADKFVDWKYNAYMTANDIVFDIGGTTSQSITNLSNRKHNQTLPEDCGLNGYGNNGNGSVMRILPLVWFIKSKNTLYMDRYQLVKKVSGLTHGHEISIIASHLLIEFALNIINKKSIMNIIDIWEHTRLSYKGFILNYKENFNENNLDHFKRILSSDFKNYSTDDIYESGFAIYTIEAAIWGLLNTNNYENCVLKVVNLGGDTDTTAAIAGGLAGILYGEKDIPQKWKEKIIKKDMINKLEIKMLKNGNI